jgi:hypothetical protein
MGVCEEQTCVIASVEAREFGVAGLFDVDACEFGECNDELDTPFFPLSLMGWYPLGVWGESLRFGCFFDSAKGVATSLEGVVGFASRALFLFLPYCSTGRMRMRSEA